MNYLVDPRSLVFNAHWINGFTKMIDDEQIPQWELLIIATDVVSSWTERWDEDQGFGSSDMTYMIKEFIDDVIGHFGGKLMTKFTPSLSVVEYSEMEHHVC